MYELFDNQPSLICCVYGTADVKIAVASNFTVDISDLHHEIKALKSNEIMQLPNALNNCNKYLYSFSRQ